MYQYTPFDREFVKSRALQYRDQLERNLNGTLADDDFRPLRLQNGWYIQRYAPMLRVAVPYGELSSKQIRTLAKIAREYDRPHEELFAQAQTKQSAIDAMNPSLPGIKPVTSPALTQGYAHFTTRQNVQFNWIKLSDSADVMDLLASVDMHGIQTSGNCIRNITSDELAGVAIDEIADPRPFGEILRQWSSLHPEFAFLPRKFKIAISGSKEDRAATAWHDVGLFLEKNTEGQLGFKVMVGGGMGRTPITGSVIQEFLPWSQIMNYLEAIVRVYNRFGRRDNIYKARIKILVKAEMEKFTHEVQEEFERILRDDQAPHTITQDELDRVRACFVPPQNTPATLKPLVPEDLKSQRRYQQWLANNVAPHQNPNLRAVTLSFKRLGLAPGDALPEQLERAADLMDKYSGAEARVTHSQNLLLPWVHAQDLESLYVEALALGLAQGNIGLLSDMIACPGGDYCALANARSIPLANAISERFQDLDELEDLGAIDLHISGCINSCGHHHSGHIGILGVDKDGQEWYQVTLGGSDGSDLSGKAKPGKVVGPSFSAHEVLGVIESVLSHYVSARTPKESFIACLERLGFEAFKAAANEARYVRAQEPTVI
ncbi:MAG: nitrite/sulfite reductase [Burkholderiaceae bacterium]